MDLYEVLGLKSDASDRDIRSAYKRNAMCLHPDRVGGGKEKEFSCLTEAYEILGDPCKRAEYDMSRGEMVWDHDPQSQRARALKEREARLQVELMEQSYRTIYELEESRNGVCIYKAEYTSKSCEGVTNGKSIDVTIPLQFKVHDSRLLIPAGESKAKLEGFYNPDHGTMSPLTLKVLYDFNNKLHEVEIGDKDELRIPLREHLVGYSEISQLRAKRANYKISSQNYDKWASRQWYKKLLIVSVAVSGLTAIVMQRFR